MIRALVLAAAVAMLCGCARTVASRPNAVPYCLSYGGQAFAICSGDRRYAI